MKPYCHMGKMCIGCSPQLIEGICPDSKAGRTVAELVAALEFVIRGVPDTWEGVQKARAAIAKATGG
jgi:hypothetical protein